MPKKKGCVRTTKDGGNEWWIVHFAKDGFVLVDLQIFAAPIEVRCSIWGCVPVKVDTT